MTPRKRQPVTPFMGGGLLPGNMNSNTVGQTMNYVVPPPPPMWSQPPPPPLPLGGRIEQPEENDLSIAVEKGERCDSKDIYRVPHDDDPDRFHWVDEKPLEYGETTDKTKTKKTRESFAVNVLHIFDDIEEEWRVSQVCVNSALLHSALENILEGYPGLTQHELKTFLPRFLPFIHRWQDLLAYKEGLDASSDAKTHLQLLQQVMEPLLKDSFNTIQDVERTNHVSFRDLDLIYVPGTIALNHEMNAAGIVRRCQLKVLPPPRLNYFEVEVDVVDFDGRRCGLLSDKWIVKEFHGLRSLPTLDISPLKGLPNEETIRKSLIQRGRRFEELRGHFFLAYTNEREERANDRMVVDARAYHKYFQSGSPEYAKLSEIGQLTWAQAMNRHSSMAQQDSFNYIMPPPPPPIGGNLPYGQSNVLNGVPEPPGLSSPIDLEPMTDEQCLLAVPTLKCFNIEKKRWEQLEVNYFHDIPWALRAFDSLVLDQGEKDLLLALVDRDQFNNGKPFDDFIDRKGQGMIMLLCGPPGVGKTLTAETVSEHLRRPLYKLGAGDLGLQAQAVEQRLDSALKLCAHFGAVLLIDEADVFLEARTSNNLQRNELVSVFLRLLEYYSGIMILTTNRIRSIDSAFESRIDITLTYESLAEGDRRKVWNNFLATIDPKDVDINETDLRKLAHWDFNGRQIKSAIKTARILAAKKREPLRAQHLDIVLKLRSKALGLMTGEAKTEELGMAEETVDVEWGSEV